MTPAVSSRRYLTPGQIAVDLGIDLRKVLAWVKAGELRACNLATRANGRKPRWRISLIDLQLFLDRRTASPTPATPRRRRKDPNVIEFFP